MIEIYATPRAKRVLMNSVNTRMIDLYMAGVNLTFHSYMTRLDAVRIRNNYLVFTIKYEDWEDPMFLHHLGSYDPVTMNGRNANDYISVHLFREIVEHAQV